MTTNYTPKDTVLFYRHARTLRDRLQELEAQKTPGLSKSERRKIRAEIQKVSQDLNLISEQLQEAPPSPLDPQTIINGMLTEATQAIETSEAYQKKSLQENIGNSHPGSLAWNTLSNYRTAIYLDEVAAYYVSFMRAFSQLTPDQQKDYKAVYDQYDRTVVQSSHHALVEGSAWQHNSTDPFTNAAGQLKHEAAVKVYQNSHWTTGHHSYYLKAIESYLWLEKNHPELLTIND